MLNRRPVAFEIHMGPPKGDPSNAIGSGKANAGHAPRGTIVYRRFGRDVRVSPQKPGGSLIFPCPLGLSE